MVKINSIRAYEILDSRGFPTIEASFESEGITSIASVPSGASTGSKESLELRDNDLKRFKGKGVLCAINNINKVIAPKIIGKEFKNQREFDNFIIELDGTENKSNLGANATLATSLCFSRLLAQIEKKQEFEILNDGDKFTIPMPMLNFINGGAHANNSLSIQEFMIIPVSAKSFFSAMRMASEIFMSLKNILSSRGLSTAVGDEGGIAANIADEHVALALLSSAVTEAGYKIGSDIVFALDVAATEIYKNGNYCFQKKKLSRNNLLEYYQELIDEYPIVSIEDPFAEEDYESWSLLTEVIGDRVQIVGDDIFTTNIKFLDKGIKEKLANSILIKPNQIGTVSETIDTIDFAKENNFRTIISHRSGETGDNFISHLSVGKNAGIIKSGSVVRYERLAKYNELIRIENNFSDLKLCRYNFKNN